jgi:hypothetical protein
MALTIDLLYILNLKHMWAASQSGPSQWLGVNWMKKDTGLIPLHDHPRYKELIARGEARLTATQTEQGVKSD